MGYFAVSLENTKEDLVKTAAANLKLYLDAVDDSYNNDYLLDFAISQLQRAKDKPDE
jgi:hypothetical protein